MTEFLVLMFCSTITLTLSFVTYRYYIRGKKIRFIFSASLSVLFLVISVFAVITTTEKSTIERLTQSHTLATIEFEEIQPSHYRALFKVSHQQPAAFDLYGDQWQVDARILSWKGAALKLGLQPIYQFERLSGRYDSVDRELDSRRSVYSLQPNKRSDSIWDYLIAYEEYIPYLDSQFGSGTYMPMAHGAKFTIKLTSKGLLAKPRNLIATKSVRQWL